jgi:malate dehydrogenase (oxaloacetate-decarboxylating)
MMVAAAEALGRLSPALKASDAPILPRLREVREVALQVALAVAVQAIEDGVAPECSAAELMQKIHEERWSPDYFELP